MKRRKKINPLVLLVTSVLVAGFFIAIINGGSDTSTAEPTPSAAEGRTEHTEVVAPAEEAPAEQVTFTGLDPQLEPLVEAGLMTQTDAGWTVDGAAVAATAAGLGTSAATDNGAYDRDLFGSPWIDTDGNGCDTRNDVLARDLASFNLDSDGCTVLSGTLDDPYTGTVIDFTRGRATSSAVQIDHIIPLAAAWRGGAEHWSEQQRIEFANDPANLEAVDGPTNGSKSDSLPGSWLPDNDTHHCVYVARVTYLADTYDIAVTPSDVSVMTDVANRCAA